MATVLHDFRAEFGLLFLDLPRIEDGRPPLSPAACKLPNVRAFLAAASVSVDIHFDDDHADLWTALCSYPAFRNASARLDTTASTPRLLQVRLHTAASAPVRQVYIGRAVWQVALMNACWRLHWAHNVRHSAEVPTTLLNACAALPGGTRALFTFDMPLRFDPPSEPNHLPHINTGDTSWYHMQLYYIAHGLATVFSVSLTSVMEHLITGTRHVEEGLADAAAAAVHTLNSLRQGDDALQHVLPDMLQRITTMMCAMTNINEHASCTPLFNTASARARHQQGRGGEGRYTRVVSGRTSSLDELRAALDITALPDTAATLDTLLTRFGADALRVLALTRGGSYRAEMDMLGHGDALAYTAATLLSIGETIGTTGMRDWMFYVHTPHDGKTWIIVHENSFPRLLALSLELRGLPHRAQWRARGGQRRAYRRVQPVTPTLVASVANAATNRPCFVAAMRFINRCTHSRHTVVASLRLTGAVVATDFMVRLWTRLLPPALTAVMAELGTAAAAAQVRRYYAHPRRPSPWTSSPNVLDALRIATEAAGTGTIMHVGWVVLTLLRSWLQQPRSASDPDTAALHAALTPNLAIAADTFENVLATDPSTHYRYIFLFFLLFLTPLPPVATSAGSPAGAPAYPCCHPTATHCTT